MAIETGGPAFPHIDSAMGRFEAGMTLRDYFAAQAMPVHATSLCRWGDKAEKEWHAEVARMAYMTADAMLAARKGGV